jgi:hypothetical protein
LRLGSTVQHATATPVHARRSMAPWPANSFQAEYATTGAAMIESTRMAR